MESTVLLWFKNDLRLHDNEALCHAIQSGKKVIPVYCFDPETYQKLPLGFPKTDPIRLAFIKQCVADLRNNLKAIGGNLKIVTGNPVDSIISLVKKYKCQSIFAEQEYATEEITLINSLESKLSNTCELHTFWGKTLYHINDIPYPIAEIPLTSKTFRIHTEKNTDVRETFKKPEHIQVVSLDNWGELPETSEFFNGIEKADTHPFVAGGETKALKRLDFYLFESQQLTSYRWTRNRSLGMEYSSKFSPYMALGCLFPRTIYEAVKRYEQEIKKNASTWWIIFEVVWRDYFTFKLMRFQNQVYQTAGFSNKKIAFENDPELFSRWCNGTTGIPFVDAHMRQLNDTGFMSNRGRVNCSSFLIHDYLIDWTWGAAYFESKLIDYDVSSNWLNWHVQAYQIWYTNPVNQANKYKAQEFIKKWVPELQSLDDVSVLIPWEGDVLAYPKPDQIFKKWQRAINLIKKGNEK